MDDAFALLKKYTDRVGPDYGTEDFCIFMYALAKMQKPKVALELGTGLGATAFWLARAMVENGAGHVWTVDNGSHWLEMQAETGRPSALTESERALDYAQFFSSCVDKFGLSGCITLLQVDMPPYPILDEKIDVLFYDYRHSPIEIMKLLIEFLPRMSHGASIFMDRVSTTFDSYVFLEHLIGLFNAGKVPLLMTESMDDEKRDRFLGIVRNSTFTLSHVTERKNRKQNSCAWLKIEPIDIVPHPRTTMFF